MRSRRHPRGAHRLQSPHRAGGAARARGVHGRAGAGRGRRAASAGHSGRGVVLSTCNRSELYGVAPAAIRGRHRRRWRSFSLRFTAFRAAIWTAAFTAGRDPRRCGICFAWPPGWTRCCWARRKFWASCAPHMAQALDHGSTGPVLNRAFQGALEVGKRVRAETEVGARPMSVSLAGIKLAERVFGNLKGHSALILGAGAVAEQVVGHLRSRSIGSTAGGESLARSRAGSGGADGRRSGAVGFARQQVLSAPDMIVTSVGSAGRC